ncbi:MAG TPA: succinate dehydrogenase cytochrome b subunit [candidate division Zixibacteria bacterium]|nr:succinate dehydrogenase cytochrome b subunit [candidate division Zixibacteria bacterium]
MATNQISRVTDTKVIPEPPTMTSIVRKFWMAVSGVIILTFVVGHMLGNLQVFLGPDQINAYAQKLRAVPALLWAVRVFFLIWALVHVVDGAVLWLRNRQSRPQTYVKQRFQEATLASRTMIWTGLAIFFFIVYHLLHYTLFVTNPEYAGLTLPDGHHNVYAMLVQGFQNPLISVVYILAIFFLAVHLTHSISSFFQTFGWTRTELQPIFRGIAWTAAAIIFIGYVSIPIGVLTGIIAPMAERGF